MLATLKTRCGCQRNLDIPFPPNPRIIVPVFPDFKISQRQAEFPDMHPTMRIREFELQDYGGGPNGFAEYLERWQK